MEAMRKMIVLLCLAVMYLTAAARKSYVNVSVHGVMLNNYEHYVKLSGDVPADMEKLYYKGEAGIDIGAVINMLAERGYEVEMMCSIGTAEGSVNYLLSKAIDDGSEVHDAIPHIVADSGDVATEVARYNLQGQPVSPDEKGIQIVVYSNYTTRTVIVE